MKNALFLLTVVALTAGCSSKGFNRGALSSMAGVNEPEFNNVKIAEAFKKKANLPKPFKLAVYFRSSMSQSKYGMYSSPQWRWTEADKERVFAVLTELKKDNSISQIFPIIDSVVPDERFQSIRGAAAQHQADAVLILGGAASVDRYTNSWGYSYLLILPALFVPGSQVDSLFIANASLWDVRNEFLYLTAEAEGMSNERYIAAFGKSDKELIEEAKATALEKLGKNISAMVRGN